MKNNVLLLFCLLFTHFTYSQTLIPDPNFEQALLNQGIDSDGVLNGQVPTSDINTLSFLDVSSQGINDLTGIEDFEDLFFLDCSDNNLTSIDLSNLGLLMGLDCFDNNLTALDLSANNSLETIYCQNNQLTNLTLGTNFGFEDLVLNCSNNLLTSLDLSTYLIVYEINCSFNMLTTLDLSNNIDTDTVIVNDNNLSSLILNNSPFANQNISNANFNTTNNPDLCCIEVENVAWSTANWTNIDPQTRFTLDCTMTQIPDNNFEQSLITQGIDSDGTINGKVLTSDISSLSFLDVSNESISDLTGIEDFTSLFVLDCSDNNLTTLDISSLGGLEVLDCSYNNILSLDLTSLNSLENIDCNDNQLTNLTLGTNFGSSDLKLNCSNNLLASLDLSTYLILESIDCSFNMLTTLDLSSNIDTFLVLANNNDLSSLILNNSPFANQNISTANFDITSNPNLFCVEVEDVAWSNTNWTNKDPQTSFSTDCSSFAYNCLTLEDANGFVGVQSNFEVVLDNTDIIKGFQFDITFPADFIFNPVDITNIGIPASFNISCANVGGNTYRVIGFSLSTDTIPVGNVAILSFPTLVGATVTPGTYTIPITNVTLSDVSNTDVTTSCPLDGSITVINSPPGDANGDQMVNVLDILSTVDYIFGNPPTVFYYDLVDLNADDTINILDVLAIQDIILGSRPNIENTSSLLGGNNYLTLNNGAFASNTSQTLSIDLYNDNIVKGAQFDFVLPTGFTFNPTSIGMTPRLNGFTVTAQEIAPQTYRVLIFSLTNALVSAGTGNILDLPIFIESSTVNTTYPIAFTGVVISDENNVDVSTTPPTVGEIIIDDTLSSDDIDSLTEIISIYPIPTRDILTVNSRLSSQYEIIDINGRLIKNGQIEIGKTEINLSWLQNGMYFVKINNKDSTLVKEIIKN